jgi:hypothetical protein
MRDDSTLVMCCVRSAQGTHVLTEELHYRDGKWIRITVVNGHEEDVRPLSFPQARQFAIEHHLEQGAIREPIPELTFLLTFEFPLILQIEGSDDLVEFDPSDWTLIGHLQDSAVNWSNDDELEIYDIFLFKSAEHWYCITHTSIDSVVGEHARIVGAFLGKPKALRMLALNGFEMTKAFRSEELVQKLTPGTKPSGQAFTGAPEKTDAEAPTIKDGFSIDGRTFHWCGKSYSLSESASRVVRVLYDAHVRGTRFLHESYIKTEAEVESDVRNVVRDNGLSALIIPEMDPNGKRIKGKWGLVLRRN